MEKKQINGFRRIFTIALLLFLGPAEGLNPAGQLLTFTSSKIKSNCEKIRRNQPLRFLSMILKVLCLNIPPLCAGRVGMK